MRLQRLSKFNRASCMIAGKSYILGTIKQACVKYQTPRLNTTDAGRTRNLTWGGIFETHLALLYARDTFCNNVTGTMWISKKRSRPYYMNSLAINYAVPTINPKDVANILNPPKAASTDWLNFVIAPSWGGCVLYLTKAICNSRFRNLLRKCSFQDSMKVTKWSFGGLLQDMDCGYFFLTAGTRLTGDLWDSPLTDLGPNLDQLKNFDELPIPYQDEGRD